MSTALYGQSPESPEIADLISRCWTAISPDDKKEIRTILEKYK